MGSFFEIQTSLKTLKMKDQNAPKRPLSGYMRFIGTIRAEVEKETGLNGIAVTKHLSLAGTLFQKMKKQLSTPKHPKIWKNGRRKWQPTRRPVNTQNSKRQRKRRKSRKSQKIRMHQSEQCPLLCSSATTCARKCKPSLERPILAQSRRKFQNCGKTLMLQRKQSMTPRTKKQRRNTRKLWRLTRRARNMLNTKKQSQSGNSR